MDFNLLFADDHLLVLDKPSGLHAVPGRGEDKQDCLSARVQAIYPDALIVHRLDRDTSGLLVMARGLANQRTLNRAFSERRVHKRYVAVVEGHLTAPGEEWNLIHLPICLDWPNRPLHIVDAQHGKPSTTRWRVLARLDQPAPATRVDLEPVTGRSHQLRVHLKAIGHPILGDSLYATPEGLARADRLLLHAYELAFEHPVSGAALSFESPAPF